jgi:hypothetical protein
MKALKIVALLLCTSAFTYAQQVTVKGNTRLNTDFRKYKTYSWAETDRTAVSPNGYVIYSYGEAIPENNGVINNRMSTSESNSSDEASDTYIYSYSVIIPASDSSVNTTIKKSIAAELEGRGYRKDDANPDLLVTYKVLERNGKLKGYTSDSPDEVNGKEVHQPSDTTTFALQPGTLLVNVIDKKKSQVLWDGFASGLIKDNTFTADPIKLKEAVHLIFTQFKPRADHVSVVK